MRRGCLVCVICNSNSFDSFIFKLCIVIVNTLKMCTFYFVHISIYFYYIFGGVELWIFYRKLLRGWGCLVCVVCYSYSFHSLMYDHSYIEHVHLLLIAHVITIFLFFCLPLQGQETYCFSPGVCLCVTNRVRSITWKPLNLYSRNFIQISIRIKWSAECKNGNSASKCS